MTDSFEMEAIVLAGGLGTRLRSAVPDVPKPMAPINGQPFLALLLRALASRGFHRVTLAVSYKADKIRDYFGGTFAELQVAYSVESEPLGTGGAIRLALQHTTSNDVFVINGDTYLEVDYGAMLLAHRQAEVGLTIAVKEVPESGRYGTLEIHGHRITAFREKAHTGTAHINAGAYILSRNLFACAELAPAFSFETDFLVPQANALRPLAFLATGLFIDLGIPEDYERARHLLSPSPVPQRASHEDPL